MLDMAIESWNSKFMYVLENSVTLQLCLWHVIYNIIFKINHKLYRCLPPNQSEKF
jgi:hypothetical protein